MFDGDVSREGFVVSGNAGEAGAALDEAAGAAPAALQAECAVFGIPGGGVLDVEDDVILRDDA